MGASVPYDRILHGPAATVALGSALAQTCPPAIEGARLVFLSGELGAGKTTLAAALLAALGVTEPVRSPTYSLIESYPITWGRAVHVDCYRLAGPGELETLGLRDYDTPGTLWVVEWPERALGALPVPDLWVRLTVLPEGRAAQFEPRSEAGRQWLQRLLSM